MAKFEFLPENELKSHIKSGSFAPCYVFFGDEHYMIKTHLKNMISSAVDDFLEFNIARFEGGGNLREICDAANSFPMMATKKAVSVADFPVDKLTSADSEVLKELLSELPATTLLIFWFESVEIDPKKPSDKVAKFFETVQANGGVICNISRKSQSELVGLLQRGAAKRRCRLDPSVARYICELCSDDLSTVVNELEKLCHFVGVEGVITKETVDKICSRSVESSIYNVSKLLLRGDLSAALHAVDDLLYMNTDPAYIITTLSSAYIDMYRALAARSASLKPENVAKDFGLFKTAFRLTEADRNLKHFSEAQLLKALKSLAECDRLIKGSKCDSRAALEACMLELTVIRQGAK
ncbi:MAG: DNA polymerase III subunit delta [Ruminococcaceae bacterium]|nr:DNA polymerase III subunit delta [Oscillospiraceae bacterium]